MIRLTAIFSTLLIAAVIAGTGANTVHAGGHAKKGNNGEITYRKELMKAVGGHMGALKAIAKGQTKNTKDMKILAEGMLGLAKANLNAYPAGSGPKAGKTRALPEIWTDTKKFDEVQKAFITQSEKLVKAASSGDPKKLASALGNLGKNACGACHKPFRAKKKRK